jgi:hypothetical protein
MKNNTNKPTDRMWLTIKARPVGDADADANLEDLFSTDGVLVPAMQPGDPPIHVQLFFRENTQYRSTDTDIQAGLHRFWNRYNGNPMQVTLTTRTDDSYKNPQKNQDALTLEHAYDDYKAP